MGQYWGYVEVSADDGAMLYTTSSNGSGSSTILWFVVYWYAPGGITGQGTRTFNGVLFDIDGLPAYDEGTVNAYIDQQIRKLKSSAARIQALTEMEMVGCVGVID
ncbi:MAG: hypothetical protein HUJ76_10250 [Parasporobacterium sp.]|nr:hypothetical protein [Parasporobacterium sp.]